MDTEYEAEKRCARHHCLKKKGKEKGKGKGIATCCAFFLQLAASASDKVIDGGAALASVRAAHRPPNPEFHLESWEDLSCRVQYQGRSSEGYLGICCTENIRTLLPHA
jgi:hypothetical protein